MIDVKINDGKFEISGTFDFGYMGTYKDEQISFYSEVEEVKEWDIVGDREFDNDEEFAEFLTGYYNNFEKKIQENIKQVNDNFLQKIICGFNDVGAFFWEIDEITIKENVPEEVEEDYGVIYDPYDDKITEIEDEFYETPNDGSIEKTDVEAFIRKSFPMLNLDRLIQGVVPEYLGLHDGSVSFQCSDDFGEEVLCGAYDELDEELTFTDWHNF